MKESRRRCRPARSIMHALTILEALKSSSAIARELFVCLPKRRGSKKKKLADDQKRVDFLRDGHSEYSIRRVTTQIGTPLLNCKIRYAIY